MIITAILLSSLPYMVHGMMMRQWIYGEQWFAAPSMKTAKATAEVEVTIHSSDLKDEVKAEEAAPQVIEEAEAAAEEAASMIEEVEAAAEEAAPQVIEEVEAAAEEVAAPVAGDASDAAVAAIEVANEAPHVAPVATEVEKEAAPTVEKEKEPDEQAEAAQLEIVLQSSMGGTVTAEEIAAKVPQNAVSAFVKVGENKIYWVDENGEEGSVKIWD